jgi:hypothetical protein
LKYSRKHDPSHGFIGEEILEINELQAEKIKAKDYVNERDIHQICGVFL